MTAREGSSNPAGEGLVAQAATPAVELVPVYAKKTKASRTLHEGKKEQSEPKIAGVLLKTINLISPRSSKSSAWKREIETFPLALQEKHPPAVDSHERLHRGR